MSALTRLHNHIDLDAIPFTERGSRLIVFCRAHRLFIRLAERWARWEHEVGHYRQRQPLIDDFAVCTPDGTPLTVTLDSDPHAFELHTALGTFTWTFVDSETLLVRLPAGRYTLGFLAWAQEATPDRRGGTLRGKRHIAYTTNAHVYANTITSEPHTDGPLDLHAFRVQIALEATEGQVFQLNVTPRLAFNRSLPVFAVAQAEARARWEDWFAAAPAVHPDYLTQYDYAWWLLRAGLLSTRFYFTREALVPSKIHYVGVWHWDQFFHALAYRHIDTRLAEDQLRILLDHQRADGMIPDAIHDEGLITHLSTPVEADVTKPPLIAWTVLKLFEHSGHHDFLEEVYEPLTRWHAWWQRDNTDAHGLGLYRHPFSSGLDDSPLWDAGMPVVSPELNAYLILQLDSLARIAELIGLPADATRHRADAAELAARVQARLWDATDGLFYATHADEPIRVRTPFNLFPLLTGRMPPAIVARLLTHLTDPQSFWTTWPVPTVAADDPHFDPEQMWRGPTWININYLFIEGLTRIGAHALARTLRVRTLDLVMRHHDIYEYYHPLTGARPPKAAPLFGWSAALFIDLALQETAARAAD